MEAVRSDGMWALKVEGAQVIYDLHRYRAVTRPTVTHYPIPPAPAVVVAAYEISQRDWRYVWATVRPDGKPVVAIEYHGPDPFFRPALACQPEKIRRATAWGRAAGARIQTLAVAIAEAAYCELERRLRRYILAHGAVQCIRVSSAQAHGRARRYPYWGAVRYVIRLRADGMPVAVALERAASERRSRRLAIADAQRLSAETGRVYIESRRGRLCTDDLVRVCAHLGLLS